MAPSLPHDLHCHDWDTYSSANHSSLWGPLLLAGATCFLAFITFTTSPHHNNDSAVSHYMPSVVAQSRPLYAGHLTAQRPGTVVVPQVNAYHGASVTRGARALQPDDSGLKVEPSVNHIWASTLLLTMAMGLAGWWMRLSRNTDAVAPLLSVKPVEMCYGGQEVSWQMTPVTAETVGKVTLQVKVEDASPNAFSGPTLVYLVTEDGAANLDLPALQKEEFTGKDGQVAMAYNLPNFAASRVLLVGMGDAKAINARKLRCAVNTAVKELKGRKLATAGIAFPEPELEGNVFAAGVVATTAILSDYFFDHHITDKERCFHLEQLTLLTSASPAAVEEQITVTHGTVLTRDLLNTRADIATPEWMANYTVEMCKEFPEIEVRVVEFAEMEEKGMNLVRAVGKGAVHKPRIVYMNYKGDPDSTKSLALVGKGLCFDTGGLNLKPTGSIEQMHMDKGGACSVLGTMQVIAKMKLKTNVVGVVAFAENAIGKDACKPHEIITSYKGLTVMNKNTDAEGRLVLADAMTYLQKEYQVDQMFTLATLTGAIVLSLGHYAAGMFTQSDGIASALTTASQPGDERVWRMPLYQEYADQLKGTMCDLHSTGTAQWGGACTAASFLTKFVEEGVEYVHLDIAGAAGDVIGADDRPWIAKGATGWGPNILYHYIKSNRCA